jgi:transcriptional regulator with XRE-family HTH domain
MTKTVFTNEYKGLIAWLKAERIEAGLTIRDLAIRLNVVHSYVGRIETLERRLDVWEYITYCRALGLDPHKGINILLQ